MQICRALLCHSAVFASSAIGFELSTIGRAAARSRKMTKFFEPGAAEGSNKVLREQFEVQAFLSRWNRSEEHADFSLALHLG
jgi:hypothetical protein